MVKASELYFKGKCNYVRQIREKDKTTIIIGGIGWKRSYKFVVKNLGKKNFKIVEDEEIMENIK